MSLSLVKRGRRSSDYFYELLRRLDRRLRPLFNDVCHNLPSKSLLAVRKQNSFEFAFVVIVYDFVRAERLTLVHSHIESAVEPVRKPAARLVDLVRRNSEVEERAVDKVDSEVVKHFRGCPEVGFYQRVTGKPFAFKLLSAFGKSLVVAIDANGFTAAAQNRFAMSAAPRRTVEVYSTDLNAERIHNLVKHYRNVVLAHRFFRLLRHSSKLISPSAT